MQEGHDVRFRCKLIQRIVYTSRHHHTATILQIAIQENKPHGHNRQVVQFLLDHHQNHCTHITVHKHSIALLVYASLPTRCRTLQKTLEQRNHLNAELWVASEALRRVEHQRDPESPSHQLAHARIYGITTRAEAHCACRAGPDSRRRFGRRSHCPRTVGQASAACRRRSSPRWSRVPPPPSCTSTGCPTPPSPWRRPDRCYRREPPARGSHGGSQEHYHCLQ